MIDNQDDRAIASHRSGAPSGAEPQGSRAKPPAAIAGHTPGPWRWEINRKHKSVELCGGPPKSGFGRFDLTVMSFKRYGVQGAAPVFWHWDNTRWVGKPQRADELAVSAEGREHHADWFALLDHPDAHLIAAAPELLVALRWLRAWWKPGSNHDTDEVQLGLAAADAAIASAEGRS